MVAVFFAVIPGTCAGNLSTISAEKGTHFLPFTQDLAGWSLCHVLRHLQKNRRINFATVLCPRLFHNAIYNKNLAIVLFSQLNHS